MEGEGAETTVPRVVLWPFVCPVVGGMALVVGRGG